MSQVPIFVYFYIQGLPVGEKPREPSLAGLLAVDKDMSVPGRYGNGDFFQFNLRLGPLLFCRYLPGGGRGYRNFHQLYLIDGLQLGSAFLGYFYRSFYDLTDPGRGLLHELLQFLHGFSRNHLLLLFNYFFHRLYNGLKDLLRLLDGLFTDSQFLTVGNYRGLLLYLFHNLKKFFILFWDFSWDFFLDLFF